MEIPKPVGETSLIPSQWLPSTLNPNTRITPNLLYGNNYKDWAYSVEMALGGVKRFGYIDGSIR